MFKSGAKIIHLRKKVQKNEKKRKNICTYKKNILSLHRHLKRNDNNTN